MATVIHAIMIREYSSYTPQEENCQKCCFLWTLGNHGGDLGYQRAKFHSSGIRGLKKAENLGNRVNRESQIYKYPVFEHKI